MVQPVNVKKFIDDFQSYLASRGIDLESLDLLKATYLNIDAESELVKRIQALTVATNVDYHTLSEQLIIAPGNIDDILYPALLYLYLNAILNGEINRAEHYWSIAECNLEQLDENARIKYFQIRFALAYDPEAKQFKTDKLLINQTNLMQEYSQLIPKIFYYFCPGVWPGFNNEESLYDYSDYQVENAIKYIMNILNKPIEPQRNKALHQTFKNDPLLLAILPLPLIFSHPQQNDATLEAGLYLLSIGVEPSYILGAARQNDTNDYRLLNHCVELLATELKEELFEDGEDNEKLNLTIFYAQHPYIPAAKFYSNLREQIIEAALLNYKPAIAYCLRIAKDSDYGVSLPTRLDHLLMLWQEKYLSTIDTLKILMYSSADVVKPSASQAALVNPAMPKAQPPILTTKINGLTVIAPSGTKCFEQCVHILVILCSAHRILINDRFSDGTLSLDNLFTILTPILALTASQQTRFQKWMDTDFGNLALIQYIHPFQPFNSWDKVNHYHDCIINSLLSCHPQYLSAWQKELLYKRLSKTLQFNPELTTAFQKLKTTCHGNTAEIDVKEKQSTPLTLDDTLKIILSHFSLPELLALSLRAVSKRFKKLTDMILLNFLNQAPEYPDKVIALRYLERILYFSFVSKNPKLLKAGINYFDKLQKLCHSPPRILSIEAGLRLSMYIEKAKNAAVAAGQLDVLGAVLPSNPDNLNYLLSESAHNNVAVIAYFLRMKDGLAHPPAGITKFQLYNLYLNELLSGQMTKERHVDCLYIIHYQLSRSELVEAEAMFHAALMCQDWALLLLLCRLHPEHYCSVLNLENTSAQMTDAHLFIRTHKCIVSENAPQWWHEVQQDCFRQLVLEKTQLLNLSHALINLFIKLPIHSGPEILSVLGSHAPQTSNMMAKNIFVKSLTDLHHNLTNQLIHVIHATQKLVNLVNDFRTHLIKNKNRGYLQIIDRFFEIPKECSLDILKQCIDKCLQRYGIDVSPAVSKMVVERRGSAT